MEAAPTWSLVAIDGADDDGGTLYVLYDAEQRMVAGACWPQVLEQIAQRAGALVKRALPTTGGEYV
jgi:hypothetical protein